MSVTTDREAPGETGADVPVQPDHADVEIVIPVYNEAGGLERSVRTLAAYLRDRFPFTTTITVVDNASTDGTIDVARHLQRELDGVTALRLEQKGRGRALRAAWGASTATVVAYMDVDLSTELDALLPLVAPLLSEHSDVAIGTRLARGSHVIRGPKREVISRCYNFLVHAALGIGFSDAQCGFKAMRADVARELLPLVEDDAWFFDTELLVQAERHGLRIHEVPVDWVDDPDSRVDIRRTAVADVKGVWRLARTRRRDRDRAKALGTASRRPRPVLARFAGVGTMSTLVYGALFLALRDPLGPYGANAVALSVCTAGNLLAHARYTFGDRDRRSLRSLVAGGLAVFATSLVITTAALWIAAFVAPGSFPAEIVALVLANAVAAAGRFVLLRAWIFRNHRQVRAPR
jgi:putative flippase GtrA